MKTTILILMLATATLAGLPGDVADSVSQTAGMRDMGRVTFLVAMDSVVTTWPDSVKAMRGKHGLVFVLRGDTLSETRMRRVVVQPGFGRSLYVSTVLGMIGSPLLMKAKYNRRESVSDHVARELRVWKEWVFYRKEIAPAQSALTGSILR